MGGGGGGGNEGGRRILGGQSICRGGSYGFQENERGTGSDGLLKGDQSLLMEYKRRTIRN